MTKEELRIVYMGTPDFAVEPLRALMDGGYNVVAVVTMPDKPVGRHGNTLQPSPVKQYAAARGLKVMQPERLKDPGFVDELRALRADIQVVVAFRMLPEVVWSMPRLGTINAHASLLPRYRGAAPINWAIINGDTETGVTTFLLKHEIDTGDILLQERVPITPDDNAETLHDRLMILSARLVAETIERLLDGTAVPRPQEAAPSPCPPPAAPKIFRDTCRIDWNQPATRIRDFIRGLSPAPGAWTTLNGKSVKIFEASLADEEEKTQTPPPGSLSVQTDTSVPALTLLAHTAAGALRLHVVQVEGKRKMPVADLLRGFKIEDGERFV